MAETDVAFVILCQEETIKPDQEHIILAEETARTAASGPRILSAVAPVTSPGIRDSRGWPTAFTRPSSPAVELSC
ncbi:hypothetical protein GCM10020000_86540 [Streptomyces olivoverticillatus]